MLYILESQENISDNIELDAIKVIEYYLNSFFDNCSKELLDYSSMLVEHGEYFSKDSFEIMVLSPKKITELLKNIFVEINNNNKKKINLTIFDKNMINNIEWNTVLEASIKQYNLSLKVTTQCEDLINKMISKLLDKTPFNQLVTGIIKNKNIAAFILGKNNYKNLQSKYQKEIYNQLQGILLNTKYRIRNQLVNYLITTLKKSNEKYMSIA